MNGGYVIVGGEVGKALKNLPAELVNGQLIVVECNGAYSELEALYKTGKPVLCNASIADSTDITTFGATNKVISDETISYTIGILFADASGLCVTAYIGAGKNDPNHLRFKGHVIQ